MTRISRRMVDADTGFAMIFTLLLTVIMVASSIAVAGLMLSQVKPSMFSKKNVRTVDAASAGMQTALGQLRSASVGGSGDLTKLPCSDPSDLGGISLLAGNPSRTITVPGDQITGTVSDDGTSTDTVTYRTVIAYFQTDPTAHETDTTSTWWTSNAIPCKAGLVKTVPSFAFIQSFGAGAALPGLSLSTTGNRTQHAIYQFSATNGNTVGGRLAEFVNGVTPQPDNMCLDAGTSPAVGTTMTMQPCLALGTVQQTWQYRSDLSIYYGGDITKNLCIANVSGTPKLETCASAVNTVNATTYPYLTGQQVQEWAYSDNGMLEAPDTGGTVGSGPCLDGAGEDNSPEVEATSGGALLLITCTGSSTDDTAWNPDPQVGAGKSGGNVSGTPGSPTNQFVNFALFGSCLDVNGQQFANKLIAYPCKQAPDQTTLTWNQVWHYQPVPAGGADGIFYTACAANAAGCVPSAPATATNDCLASPGVVNGLVTGAQCPTGTPPDNELWQATGNIPSNYPSSYQLINKADGLCMAADPSQISSGFAQIVVTSCDGSQVPSSASAVKNPLLLKWNAPPTTPTPGLSNILEDGGSINH
jgi:Tfp pilus assembly protein PilX